MAARGIPTLPELCPSPPGGSAIQRSQPVIATCIVITTLTSAWAMETTKPAYPTTKAEPLVEKLHGVAVADPYRWLEDGDNAEVKAWTDQQNAFTKAFLDKLPGREAIHQRLGQLLEIGRISVAHPAGGRYFYTKRTGTQNQAILYVRDQLHGADRVLVDPNTLSADGTTALDWWFPSEDGKLLAYGISQSGSEISVLHVRDVSTGKDRPDVIAGTRACSLAWTPDAKGFYYTRSPQVGSPIREAGKERLATKDDTDYFRHVFFHQLGTDPAKDRKVFGEGRQKEDWPGVELSPDGRFLVITVEQGWSKTEVYLRDAASTTDTFVPIVEGVEAIFAPVVRNDILYLRTNDGAPRYRVFKVNPARPARANWIELIKEGPDVIDHFAAVGDRLIGQYMVNATSRLRLFEPSGKLQQEVALATLGTISGLGGEWDGKELFYDFSPSPSHRVSSASTLPP